MRRRIFLVVLTGAVVARRSHAQEVVGDTSHGPTMSGPMDDTAYRPVRLRAKAGVAASMSDEDRDALEHRIKCQCGCVLDVYTCRTTDFTCPVSPGMHRDVMSLVAGGYGAVEILAAFETVYGERVLMSPVREGFNWLGYLMPFVVILGGGVAVWKWTERRRAAATTVQSQAPAVSATPEEAARIEAAVRSDQPNP